MAEQEPVELITRYLSNEATPEEQQQLLDWIARDSSHQKIFQHYSEAWRGKNHHPQQFNSDSALAKLNARIDAWEVHQQQPVKPLLSWYAIAAAIALLMVAGGFLFQYAVLDAEQPIAYINKKALSGERIVVTLPDGSTIRLNAHAAIRYPENFHGSKREVYLEGEAFFDVQRDESKPFIIHTGAVNTEVLGTSFNVKSDSADISVAVAEGKVKVSDGSVTEVLTPSEKVSYHKRSGLMKKQRVDVAREIAWTKNTIIFEDDNLLKVSQMLEQWYDVKIQFTNNSLKHCLITGTYTQETLPHILEAIAFSTGVHYTIQGKEITLSGRGCEK